MTAEQEMIAKLEAEFPGWQVWVVHRAVQGPVWCARPWSDEKAVVNLDSAEELRDYLDEQSYNQRWGDEGDAASFFLGRTKVGFFFLLTAVGQPCPCSEAASQDAADQRK